MEMTMRTSIHQYPAALQAAVEAALAAYPQDEARILRGAEIVARGGVREPEAGSHVWNVGIYHYYPVNGTCPCPDTVMNSVARCKHRYAKALYKKMHTAPVVRSLYFYADLAGVAGTATVWEDGRIMFQAYDDDTPIACTYDEIVLAGRKDLVDSYYAS
jgi:hypothetical protein